jgi:hypothetical protein
MKNKLILTASLIILFALIVRAQPVDIKIVKQVAINAFYNSSANINKSTIAISELIPVKDSGQKVLYYIINFKNKGFAIISAEKAMRAVLGTCTSNNFKYEDAPPGLLYLLERYKEEITELRKQKIAPSKKDIAQWDKYNVDTKEFHKTKSLKSVTAMINTEWGQQSGYNRDCPETTAGNLTPAGCVAVAMA